MSRNSLDISLYLFYNNMTDTSKEKSEKKKPTYKYGEHELDLNTYIHNLGTNLNTYLDKVKKDWTEDQRSEFTTAFDRYLNGLKEQLNTGVERFSTNNYGRITDLQGVLSNTDNDDIDPVGSEYYYNKKGERITTDDYNKLSARKQKDYQTFSANREVANYFKIIGEKIKNAKAKETPDTTKYFDLDSNGFVQFHANKYNPNGGVWDGSAIMDLDPYDENTKKRGIENRMKLLKDTGYEYLDQLDSNIDFSKSRWKTRDEYIKFARGLFDRLQDGVSAQDYLDFGQIGISRNFLEPYVTTEKEVLTPQQEAAADAEAQSEADTAKRKEQEEAYKAMMRERLNIYRTNVGQWDENDTYALGGLTYWNPTTGFDQTGFDASFNKTVAPEYYDAQGKFTGIDKYINDYLTGDKLFTPEGKRALSAIIGSGKYETIETGPYKGKFYIPQTSDRTTNMGLVYDPITGGLQRVFIGDLPSQAERIKREWMEAQGITNREDRYKLFKEGGTIDLMQLGGGFSMDAWMDENRDKALKERAKKAGRTEEQQRAGERKTNEDALDPSNPNAGWKATDTARVAASIADIISMVSAFVPGAGTIVSGATGIGSSLTTFGADWAEDGLDWGDFKNLGANLGLDVLGLIPGGGAASKGVKIAKTLGKYASRAMAAVAGMQGLANSNNIIASINKMTTDPTNLTVDDWRNISQGFGLLTGGVAAGTRKVKKTIAEADMKVKTNGAIAVEMVDKQGNKKMVAFDGNDAQAIRKAQQSGNLDELRKATVGKYEQFRDWDLSTTGNVGWRSVKGDNGWQLPFGAKEGKARIFDMYGDKNGNLYTKGGNWQADVKTGKPIDSTTELTTATVEKDLAANRKAIMDELMAISERKKKHVTNLEERVKKSGEDITKKKEDLKVADEAGDIAQHRQLTSDIQTISDRKTRMSKLLQEIKAGNIKSYDQWKSKYLQGTGKDAVVVFTNNPHGRSDYQIAFDQILKDLNLQPSYLKYERGGRFNNVRRFLGGGDAQMKNVANPGDWFTHMFSSPEMKAWFNSFDKDKKDTWEIFNTLQDSWALNKQNTGYNGQYAIKDKTGGVGRRQAEWNSVTGTNPIFERIEGLKRNGGSSDNPEGGYVDNVFGAQEYFRHGGTSVSWEGKDNELTAAKEYFKNKGFDYYLADNGMYKLKPLENTSKTEETPVSQPTTPVDTSKAVYTDPTVGNDKEKGKEDSNKQGTALGDIIGGLFNNPTLTFGVPRAMYSDRINRKMTDMMKEDPFLKNPFEVHRTVHSDLDAEMQGQRAEAQLTSMASRPLTSDGSLQTAAQLEAKNKGQQYVIQGKEKSNDVYRQTEELAWQQEKENALNRHTTAMTDSLAMHETAANNRKHEAAYLASKHKIWDTLGKQFEYEKRTELEENKAAQDTLIHSDIHNSVMTRAITEGEQLGLSPEQIEALKLLNSGKTFSSLSTDQQQAVLSANNIIQKLETSEWAKYKGLKRYDAARQFIKQESNPLDELEVTDPATGKKLKDGGKIAVAGIRAKTADAERFQKLILESIKRHEKALDRLSKSMTSYVKDIMK